MLDIQYSEKYINEVLIESLDYTYDIIVGTKYLVYATVEDIIIMLLIYTYNMLI